MTNGLRHVIRVEARPKRIEVVIPGIHAGFSVASMDEVEPKARQAIADRFGWQEDGPFDVEVVTGD